MKINSTQKFCDLLSWFFDVIGENVRSIIANKVSELVYESCKTNSIENIQWALNFSKKVGTLEEQMGKIYSDDNTLLTLICRKKDADSKALEILLHAGFPEEFLLYKVEGKNALVWARESGNSKVEQVLLGTDERKRIFEKPEKEQEIRGKKHKNIDHQVSFFLETTLLVRVCHFWYKIRNILFFSKIQCCGFSRFESERNVI